MRSTLPLIIVAFFMIGCGGSSVNKGQFDRLKRGMSSAQVEDFLGKGKDLPVDEVERLVQQSVGPDAKIAFRSSEYRGIRWGSEKKNITVIFQNDRLVNALSAGL